jgi:inosine triphosphate pyrophosphatase
VENTDTLARIAAHRTVLVTGNANKLKEVKAILAAGDSGIEVTARAVDGKSNHTNITRDEICGLELIFVVPEVQGSTQEVALAKVRAAAEKVRSGFLNLHAYS